MMAALLSIYPPEVVQIRGIERPVPNEKPVIDRCYELREVPEAIRYLEEGHARGKVVITAAN